MRIKKLVVGPLLTNCYILESENEALVVDPGGNLKEILKEIEGKSLNYILLTHYHWDHTLVAEKLKKETGAKILIHEKEKEFLNFKADEFLKDGQKIFLGKETLKIIHTPGHSPGSVCILGKDFVLTGDTIFEDGFGRTDLAGGSQKELEESLEKLKKILKKGTRVLPGHGDEFLWKG